MRQHFPELRLCENDWKADQIASDNYPSWRAHHFGADKHLIKQESSPDDNGDTILPPAKRPQHPNDVPALPATKKTRLEPLPVDGPSNGNSDGQQASNRTKKDTARAPQLKVCNVHYRLSPAKQVCLHARLHKKSIVSTLYLLYLNANHFLQE